MNDGPHQLTPSAHVCEVEWEQGANDGPPVTRVVAVVVALPSIVVNTLRDTGHIIGCAPVLSGYRTVSEMVGQRSEGRTYLGREVGAPPSQPVHLIVIVAVVVVVVIVVAVIVVVVAVVIVVAAIIVVVVVAVVVIIVVVVVAVVVVVVFGGLLPLSPSSSYRHWDMSLDVSPCS